VYLCVLVPWWYTLNKYLYTIPHSSCTKSIRLDSLELHVDVRHDEFQLVARERTTGRDVIAESEPPDPSSHGPLVFEILFTEELLKLTLLVRDYAKGEH
jgi:hypothetical protein